MDWVLPVILVLGLPVALAVWLIARAVSARASINALLRRLDALELEIFRLKRAAETPPEPIGAEHPTAGTPSTPQPPVAPDIPPQEPVRPTPAPPEAVVPR